MNELKSFCITMFANKVSKWCDFSTQQKSIPMNERTSEWASVCSHCYTIIVRKITMKLNSKWFAQLEFWHWVHSDWKVIDALQTFPRWSRNSVLSLRSYLYCNWRWHLLPRKQHWNINKFRNLRHSYAIRWPTHSHLKFKTINRCKWSSLSHRQNFP